MKAINVILWVALMGGAADAQERLSSERPFTPRLTCAAVKAIVERLRDVTLASSSFVYERVHRDGGACGNESTAAPAFEPTLDQPNCFAGWRCKQRNSGGDTGL